MFVGAGDCGFGVVGCLWLVLVCSLLVWCLVVLYTMPYASLFVSFVWIYCSWLLVCRTVICLLFTWDGCSSCVYWFVLFVDLRMFTDCWYCVCCVWDCLRWLMVACLLSGVVALAVERCTLPVSDCFCLLVWCLIVLYMWIRYFR